MYMSFFSPNLPVTLKKTKFCEGLLLLEPDLEGINIQ